MEIENESTPKESPKLWQRFTERARRVVFFAQEEAGRLGENYVSTEHLLLGLTLEEDSVAARILDRVGISLARIRSDLERQVERGEGRMSQDMQLTPRAKRVIDLSYDEARQLNNNYIGTEHLLLGLIREGEGLAGRVLNGLGAELERTRDEVLILQDESRPGESQRGPYTNSERTRQLRVPYGYLGVTRATEGRTVVEVAMDAAAFTRLADVFTAKDVHGYRAMADGDQTMFLLPAGIQLKVLVPPTDSGAIAESVGCYVRVLAGDYIGYAGWIFRGCFERTGPDETPFPPTTENSFR